MKRTLNLGIFDITMALIVDQCEEAKALGACIDLEKYPLLEPEAGGWHKKIHFHLKTLSLLYCQIHGSFPLSISLESYPLPWEQRQLTKIFQFR